MRKILFAIVASLFLASPSIAQSSGGYYGPGALPGPCAGFGTAAGTCAQGGVVTAGGPTGSATVAPIITYNAAGQLTTVSSATITPAVGSVTGLGTGIATALGVNVGTAGAPVVNGGALGTPSSGTLTNATGLPVSALTGGGTSFTPGIAFGGGTTGLTYTSQYGRYTTEGNKVCFTAYVNINSKGSSTGSLTITGLPAAASGISAVSFMNSAGLTLTGSYDAYVVTSQTSVTVNQNTSGTVTTVTNTNVANGADMGASGCYFTN
jgi:hypothetical protein